MTGSTAGREASGFGMGTAACERAPGAHSARARSSGSSSFGCAMVGCVLLSTPSLSLVCLLESKSWRVSELVVY